MFSTKCQAQNDRTSREKIPCVSQNLPLKMFFAIKTSIFQLRPLLRFLCPINSFYRRYVSCMSNKSNRCNRLNILKPLDTWFPSNTLNTSNTWKSEVSFCTGVYQQVHMRTMDMLKSICVRIENSWGLRPTPHTKNNCFLPTKMFSCTDIVLR